MTNALDTHARRAEHDWTADEIHKLTRLWAEGFTGTEIGRRLGITKSAAIGKVRRLRLTARPGPIHVRPVAPPPRVVYAPLVPFVPVDPAVTQAAREARLHEFAAMPVAHGQTCQFPLWGDERPTHEYCSQTRIVGKPYCAAHCAVAYETAPSSGSGRHQGEAA